HPPTVPWLAWAGLKVLGPAGWGEAWKTGAAPSGFEGALRLPFLALHVLGLFALWWAVRQSGSAILATAALAFAALLPASALYAPPVNYENPCYAFLLLACGFHARFVATEARRDLFLAAVFVALASTVTFTPIFFLPGLVLQTHLVRGWRRAATEGG